MTLQREGTKNPSQRVRWLGDKQRYYDIMHGQNADNSFDFFWYLKDVGKYQFLFGNQMAHFWMFSMMETN